MVFNNFAWANSFFLYFWINLFDRRAEDYGLFKFEKKIVLNHTDNSLNEMNNYFVLINHYSN